MPERLSLSLALAATMSIGAAKAADLCCDCGVPCAPHAHVYVKPFYVVEQGPVYGGPHIVTTPRFERFNTPPARYPVMRETYYYPTYRDSYLLPPWYKPSQSRP
jgi:hypothetical protein